MPAEQRFGVWLGERRAGTIRQLGDRTRFSLDHDYQEDPEREVLGLVFEERPTFVHVSSVRLAPWFSNLLPEGRLRDWIAEERGVSRQREMELMTQVGHDLPGAVRILPEGEMPTTVGWGSFQDTYPQDENDYFHRQGIRFSLAGVAMKFSMIKQQDRLTLPASGQGGDWIVKLPDRNFQDVPRNEFAMMSLAKAVGIEVPDIMLVPREKVDSRLPQSVWPEREPWAYAIRRFDRDEHRNLVHIEDLAQVRNVYPDRKYDGNFETVASLIFRQRDGAALQEFARRLTFSILIGNSDAHLKNWSLIYQDPRIPTLSPAYDLVSTSAYALSERPQDMGLKFGGSRDFHSTSLSTFGRLQVRLGATGTNLVECAKTVVERTAEEWPEHANMLAGNQALQDAIDRSIRARTKTLLHSLRPIYGE
jgi:serine/threonine-protein kinase HipA